MKTCSKCGTPKPESEFYKRSKKTGRLRPECIECSRLYYMKYKTTNGDKLKQSWNAASKRYYTTEQRQSRNLKQYGLTQEDYNVMFDSQDGVCVICKEQIKLVVDHCHDSGKVRGLLCHYCNLGLGHFKDDVKLLQSAILYLNDAG